MVQTVGGFHAVVGESRSPAAPQQNDDFGRLAQALESMEPAGAPARSSAPSAAGLPAGGWALQEIRSRQIWADEYNEYLRQCYETRVSHWETAHRDTPDLAGMRPEEPTYQSTDPLAIARDFDRLVPNPPGCPSFTEMVSLANGATGYHPWTAGEGLTADWYEQENRWWPGSDARAVAWPFAVPQFPERVMA